MKKLVLSCLFMSLFLSFYSNSYSMKKKIVLTLLCIILVVFFVFGLVLGSFDFTRSKIIEKTDYYLVGWMSARNSLLGVISQR